MREQSCAVRDFFAIFAIFSRFFVIFAIFRDFFAIFENFRNFAIFRSRSRFARASRKIQVCKMTKIAKNTDVQRLKLLKYRCAATKIAKFQHTSAGEHQRLRDDDRGGGEALPAPARQRPGAERRPRREVDGPHLLRALLVFFAIV